MCLNVIILDLQLNFKPSSNFTKSKEELFGFQNNISQDFIIFDTINHDNTSSWVSEVWLCFLYDSSFFYPLEQLAFQTVLIKIHQFFEKSNFFTQVVLENHFSIIRFNISEIRIVVKIFLRNSQSGLAWQLA